MSSLSIQELEHFEALSDTWWDPQGAFKPLHLLNPARLSFIRQHLFQRFSLNPHILKPYEGLNLLDVGCGGGILTEPLARCGAKMTGLDAGAKAIAAAQEHSQAQGLEITYVQETAESWAQQGHQYDAVISMEVIEHVADVGIFINALTQLLKPEGLLILSTLNRTWKSYLVAILGAEYILRLLPRKTHDWSRFLTPAELSGYCRKSQLTVIDIQGMHFKPWSSEFVLGTDVDINYLLCAQKRI